MCIRDRSRAGTAQETGANVCSPPLRPDQCVKPEAFRTGAVLPDQSAIRPNWLISGCVRKHGGYFTVNYMVSRFAAFKTNVFPTTNAVNKWLRFPLKCNRANKLHVSVKSLDAATDGHTYNLSESTLNTTQPRHQRYFASPEGELSNWKPYRLPQCNLKVEHFLVRQTRNTCGVLQDHNTCFFQTNEVQCPLKAKRTLRTRPHILLPPFHLSTLRDISIHSKESAVIA